MNSMLLKFFFSVASLLMSTMALAQAPDTGPQAPKEIEAKIRAALAATKIKSVSVSPFAGVYTIVMGRNIAYSDAEGRFMIVGNMIDMKSRKNLTAELTKSVSRIDPKEIPSRNIIKRVNGSGKNQLYVFTDPHCGYCRKLEDEIDKLKDTTINFVLTPILGDGSVLAAQGIWCAKDRLGAYKSAMKSEKEEDSIPPSCENPIGENVKLAREFGIRATPMLVNAAGDTNNGYLDASDIEKFMSNKTPG